VASWGDIKSKVVYYFGRDIPDAWSRRDKLVSIHGSDKGLRLWKEWLESDRPPLLLFGRREDTAEIARVGFAPLASYAPPGTNPREPMLFRFEKDLTAPPPRH
jgi:hypothetical protein